MIGCCGQQRLAWFVKLLASQGASRAPYQPDLKGPHVFDEPETAQTGAAGVLQRVDDRRRESASWAQLLMTCLSSWYTI